MAGSLALCPSGLSLQTNFSSLPAEIQCQILPFLDPIALISLSQTNRYLRRLISPERSHFVKRLLQLELDFKYGGIIPRFHAHDNLLLPPCDDLKTWATIRYACSGCLKLLSHKHFDNHSLLRLGLRKPPLGSVAATQLSGWEIGDAKARGLRRQARLRAETETRRRWQELRQLPSHYFDNGLPLEELADVELSGLKRERRMCNECCYQQGVWARPTTSNAGSARTPVIKSRPMRYRDATERYFPGLFSYSAEDLKGFPERLKQYRTNAIEFEFWTTYRVRCPTCAIWQEMAAFRKGEGFGFKVKPRDLERSDSADQSGPDFDNWKCNRCVANEIGTEELARMLLSFWKHIVDPELHGFNWRIAYGWHFLKCYTKENKQGVTWKRILQWHKGPYRMAPSEWELFEKEADFETVSTMDPEARFQRFAVWSDYVEGCLKPSGVWKDPTRKSGLQHGLVSKVNRWFRSWTDNCVAMEHRTQFFQRCTREFEADPGRLVDYVLQEGVYQ
ncbi:MAG: hypothetical protein M1818_002619 [Claussenomyces sp. TS43310]|nr:MAG: hypothetical protein M1818_002619 [Claussenomyces sp. TS43310]